MNIIQLVIFYLFIAGLSVISLCLWCVAGYQYILARTWNQKASSACIALIAILLNWLVYSLIFYS